MLKAWKHPLALACAALLSACDFNNEGTALATPDAAVDAVVPARTAEDAGPVVVGTIDGGTTALLDAQLQADASPSLDASDAAQELPHQSFETAKLLWLPAGVRQDIEHSAQKNYFAFDAEAGGFYALQTSSGRSSPNVAISLYDENRKLLAQNDQGSLWPGDGVDARLVVRTPHAGRYFVKVQDDATPAAFFTDPSLPERYYRLDVRALKPDSEGVTYVQPGQASDVAFAFDADSKYLYTTVVGLLRPSAVETISLTGLVDRALLGHVLEPGTAGDGSTGGAGPVQVRRSSDQQLLAESPGTPGQLKLFPPISAASYTLSVSAPVVVGDNGFFAVDLALLPEDPREQHEVENALLAQAEPITLTGTGSARGMFLSDVPGGDVDYYSFSATAGQTAGLSCTAQSSGSGARQLHAELRDATDQTLATATEAPNHDLSIASFAIPQAGTYAVRLSSDHTPAAGEAEPWVRCTLQLKQ